MTLKHNKQLQFQQRVREINDAMPEDENKKKKKRSLSPEQTHLLKRTWAMFHSLGKGVKNPPCTGSGYTTGKKAVIILACTLFFGCGKQPDPTAYNNPYQEPPVERVDLEDQVPKTEPMTPSTYERLAHQKALNDRKELLGKIYREINTALYYRSGQKEVVIEVDRIKYGYEEDVDFQEALREALNRYINSGWKVDLREEQLKRRDGEPYTKAFIVFTL